MPSMANITIKKADGTTDIVWTAASPSAGDTVPAVWRSNTVSTIMGHRPRFQLALRDNAAGDGRVFKGALFYPHTMVEGGTNKVVLLGTTPIRFEGTLPAGVPVADLKEAIYQAGNLVVSALVRTALEEQYAPS